MRSTVAAALTPVAVAPTSVIPPARAHDGRGAIAGPAARIFVKRRALGPTGPGGLSGLAP